MNDIQHEQRYPSFSYYYDNLTDDDNDHPIIEAYSGEIESGLSMSEKRTNYASLRRAYPDLVEKDCDCHFNR